jgi:hypothetical protein|tara:strand:- start:1938 stop:2129 length:192 start_codon:yes stop_codon:yes gene_type:complete
MKKLILFIFILSFISCQKYETISQPLNYKDYQSSIDTTFNYLEDIKDWEGIYIYVNEEKEKNI